MEKQKLILYLRDVFELEKQKRVAQKTINYMAEEYQKAKGNFEEGQKRYNMKMKASHYIPLGICVFFILSMVINMIEMFESDISFSSPGRGVLRSFVYAVISGAVFLYFYKKDKDEQIELNAMAAVLGHKGEQDMAVLNKNYW